MRRRSLALLLALNHLVALSGIEATWAFCLDRAAFCPTAEAAIDANCCNGASASTRREMQTGSSVDPDESANCCIRGESRANPALVRVTPQAAAPDSATTPILMLPSPAFGSKDRHRPRGRAETGPPPLRGSERLQWKQVRLN